VVQYRGKLMPLVAMRESFRMQTEGRQPILVFSDQDSTLGLMVDEIVDIVESELNIELRSTDQGILGSAVIAGQATEIIDVGYYLTRAFGDWFRNHEDVPFGQAGDRHRVLLVDDSPFFRNLMVPLLSVEGYAVETAETAEGALKRRDSGEVFSAIISDIEMPGMNGFDFAQEVRHDARWRGTPIIAHSSHASAADFARGHAAGFTDYVSKADRGALLNSLAQILSSGGNA
jgi:two-component system chemotaxis sensor kinase CheA